MVRNKYYMHAKLFSFLIAIMLFCGGGVFAAVDGNLPGSVHNKLKLLDWLLHDSPASKRIQACDDSGARDQLIQAQLLWEEAVAHKEKGEYELADKKINEGLQVMTRVSRLVKDLSRVKQARQKLYKQVKDHIDMFIIAFDRIAQEKGEDHVWDMLDREELDAIMSEAQSSYDGDELALANHLMRQAADMVDSALSDARHADVLLDELSFESHEEEYTYELKRNESYVMLIDLMQKKTAASQASASYVKKIIEANSRLRELANQHVEKGEVQEGIKILEKGTDKLSRALRVSGASF